MEKLLEEHSRLIAFCADKLCRQYHCIQLYEDLISVGNLTLLQRAGSYDGDSGAMMSTYLYPFLMGDMRREIEKNLCPVSLSKDEFRKHGALWQRAFSSLDDVRETEKSLTESVEQQVFHKIYLECLKREFEKLSYRERQILGGFFGVYGYPQQTISELAEEFQLTENGLIKTKDKALKKLHIICMESDFGIWNRVRRVINRNN